VSDVYDYRSSHRCGFWRRGGRARLRGRKIPGNSTTAPHEARISTFIEVMSVINHPVVSEEQWIATRRELLVREKELTRQQDRIAAARRELPWLKVTKEYFFETPEGRVSLSDLFDGRSQLIVKHNMLNPKSDLCVGCSFEMDHIEGALLHLPHRDVTFVAISRAPVEQIQAAQRRMGWSARWVSSLKSDFNYDFHASFRPEDVARGAVFYNYQVAAIPIEDLSGFSVFYKDENGDLFLTYASFGRGQENILSTYVMLDMTPKGRNETERGNLTDWVRLHDRYDTNGSVDRTGQFVAAEKCCQ